MDNTYLSELNLSEKEQKILDAATKVFSEKGFSAATTKEIAINAGIAEGTIFRYFKTKKDILRGILLQTINLMSSKLVLEGIQKILAHTEGKDLRQILKEVLHDRLKLVNTLFPMARIIITEALYHEDVREAIYENIIHKALITFEPFHKHMVDQGIIRPDIGPTALFRSILGNIAIFIAQRKLFGDKFNLENFDGELDKMIDIILYGIAILPEETATSIDIQI